MSTVQVRTFGSFEVSADGGRLGARDFGGRKPKQLLELLVLGGGRFVARDELADQLWGEDLPSSVTSSLEHYVSVLRRRLASAGGGSPSVVLTEPGGYRLDADRVRVDLYDFEARCAELRAGADRSVALAALRLVSGALLEDEPYAEWAVAARERHRVLLLRLHRTAGELALADGDDASALAHAREAVRLDPLDEAAVRMLMEAAYRQGEQAEALRAYDELRRRLADELGADPLPQTQSLRRTLLAPPGAVAAGAAAALPAPRRPAGQDTAGGGSGEGTVERVLAVLTARPPAARPGGLRTVVVDGELGIGKTTLVDRLAARVQRPVRVSCTRHTQGVQGALVDELITAVVGDADADAHRVLDDLASSVAGGALAVRHVRDLARVLGRAGPWTALVDDVHLADRFSLAVLAALARRSTPGQGGVPGALVLVGHLARTPPGHPARSLPADLRVSLSPLDAAGLAEAFGVADPDAADRLHARSGGLPGLAGADPLTGAEVAAVAEAAERIRDRLRSGDEAAYRVLTACAVAAERFGVHEVAQVVGQDAAAVAEVLERLCERHVLEEDEDGHRFRYPVVRDVVRAGISASRLRVLEQQLHEAG